VHAVVTIPSDIPQAATLRSFLDGTLLGEQPVTTAVDTNHVTKATVELAVPFAPDDPQADWRVDLVWRSLTAPGTPITLQLPSVTSTIGCDAPCNLPAGAIVDLVIAAPKDIHASSATYTTSTTTTGPIEATLATSTVNQANATRIWQTALIAPTTATTWRIQVSVAGYPATTILATIVP
jgi:hypothetical protein